MDLPVTRQPQPAGISPPGTAAGARGAGAPPEDQAETAFADLLAAGRAEAASEAALQDAAAAATAKADGLLPESDESVALPGAANDPTAVLLLAAFAPLPIAIAAPPPGEARSEGDGEQAPAFLPAGERRGRVAMLPVLGDPAGVKTGAAIRADAGLARELADAAPESIEQPAAGLSFGAHAMLVDAGRDANSVIRAPVTAELRTPVDVSGWDTELGKTLVWMAEGKHALAALRLNPPALGPLEIVIALGGDDGREARVAFVSPHAAVRDAIESAMPRLREMMAESGISLGQTAVNAESSHRPGHPDLFRPQRAPAGGPVAAQGEQLAAVPAARARIGIVDIFA